MRDVGRGTWQERFVVYLWWIWRWRNEENFSHTTPTMERKSDIMRLKIQEITTTFSNEDIATWGDSRNGSVWVGWKRPYKGWLKLNVDGCVHEYSQMAGAGGVLRNDEGKWIQGFAVSLGCCSIEAAEVWAIIPGMRLAWTMASKCLIIETDCLTVAPWNLLYKNAKIGWRSFGWSEFNMSTRKDTIIDAIAKRALSMPHGVVIHKWATPSNLRRPLSNTSWTLKTNIG